MTDQYAVVGNPIAHSKSPVIHQLFAGTTNQDLTYNTLLAPLEAFEETIKDFFAQGGKGLNVTVPFKQNAWHYAQQLTEAAKRAGAVNTLWLDQENQLCGDNTDGVGLVTDLEINQQVALKNKKILILGAGGAVRGILEPVIAKQPAKITIANRTVVKADKLADDFADLMAMEAVNFSELSETFDIIINGTSASLHGNIPPLPEVVIDPQTICYDMMYSAEATPFNQWAEQKGSQKQIDGLGMLVEQAAAAFHIWRGVKPTTKDVIEKMRREL
ncbi:shikimate dehydrogenase [Endozoicomonas sp. SM1973]|uniref:Shikimate dehydrogenase (NADP(+)) n=1 Tax=Spartinivicinus marinus TaxID=2994442 RepID=A0A853I293_9GAMM|nr:shikimate dehydrogenase [Spartinivicinus marinus]MCX4026926.1 shikimate dehydrogenase [Spartinivicinus marinus]NYZ66729.1 shikimate dehydrogenase [Spartinivicinus marinus]